MNHFFFRKPDGSLTTLTQETLCPNGEFRQVSYVQCTIGQYVIGRDTIPLATVIVVGAFEFESMPWIKRRIHEFGENLFPHLDSAVFLLVEGSITGGKIISFDPGIYFEFRHNAPRFGIDTVWSTLATHLGYDTNFVVRWIR